VNDEDSFIETLREERRKQAAAWLERLQAILLALGLPPNVGRGEVCVDFFYDDGMMKSRCETVVTLVSETSAADAARPQNQKPQ
jgi:hypothetical protein